MSAATAPTATVLLDHRIHKPPPGWGFLIELDSGGVSWLNGREP